MVARNYILEKFFDKLSLYITILEYDDDYRCQSRIVDEDTRAIVAKEYDPLSFGDE